MKNILALICSFITIASFAQTEIKVEDAKNHVGDVVKICTKIFGGKFLQKDTLTLLNAGGYYPDAPLTIVIRADARKNFNNPPEEFYKNKMVCITGKIDLFKDKPQIVVTTKKQLAEQ